MRDKVLRFFAKLVCTYPKTVIILFNVIALLSLFYTIFNIKISTDYDALRSKDLPYVREYHKVQKNFGDNNFLMVVIESGEQKEQGKEIARLISNRISKLSSVNDVFYKVDINFFKQNSFLFMDDINFNTINEVIENSKLELRKSGEISNINNFFTYFINRFKSKEANTVDTLLLYYFLKEFNSVFNKGVKHSVIKEFLYKRMEEFEEDGYFFTDTKKLLFILVLPKKDHSTIKLIERPLEEIREVVSSVRLKYPSIPIGITGQPVIQSDEMDLTSRETTYAAIISIILVSILFILSLRSIARPLLAVYTLLISIIISFAIASIYPGRLTILSIVFTVMMIGLGIDFGIHIISRYYEELSRGRSIYVSIENTLLKTGRSNLSGIVSAVIAFYMALLVDFQGLRELGFIAGTGLLVILFSTLLLLPALLIVYDKKKVKLKDLYFVQFHFLERIIAYNRTVLIVIGFITLFFSIVILVKGVPKFNNNLMDLQAHGIESVNYEMKLISNSYGSSWFFTLFSSKDLKESDKIVSKLSQKDAIGKIDRLRSYVPYNQEDRIRQVESLKKDLSWIMTRTKKRPKPVSVSDIKTSVSNIKSLVKSHYKLSKGGSSSSSNTLVIDFEKELIKLLNSILGKLDNKDALNTISHFQERFFADILNGYAKVKELLNPSLVDIDNIPSIIRYRFVGKDNSIATYASPRHNIWLSHELEKFINDIRSVDSVAVGSAINFYEDTKRIKNGFKNISVYVLIAILILLLLDFRSLWHSIIALIPLIISMIWLFGIMSLFNIYFNIGNSFSVPLLIGICVAYGIHIVHRFREEKTSLFITKSTGTAVILTALTTIIGFASLILATHRGTVSLGVVMVIGITSSLIISIIFLPALLEYVRTRVRG